MGSFFTNISVLKSGFTRKKLTAAMNALNYQPSDTGAALQILPQNGRWCTIHADLMDMLADALPDALAACSDAVLMVCCFDSDFLLLQLTRNHRTETVCVGEPYDPDELEIEFTPEHWLPVVRNIDAFLDIIDDEYVFAEECLEPLGELMGFNAAQINVTPEELTENPPEEMRTLYFSNAAAANLRRINHAIQLAENLPQENGLLDMILDVAEESKPLFFDDED